MATNIDDTKKTEQAAEPTIIGEVVKNSCPCICGPLRHILEHTNDVKEVLSYLPDCGEGGSPESPEKKIKVKRAPSKYNICIGECIKRTRALNKTKAVKDIMKECAPSCKQPPPAQTSGEKKQ